MNSVTEIVWKDIQQNEELEAIIEKVIQKCFEVEHINPTSLYICVTLTDPKNIREINKKYRNIDKETDVLSFPMFEKDELDKLIATNLLKTFNLKNGALQDIMGDIIISIERVEEQAQEYGHSFEREFAYMLVHGFYHLRGYDHMVEEEKAQMREKEENVLSQLNITRGE
jgi:probable rRNA maturation factor